MTWNNKEICKPNKKNTQVSYISVTDNTDQAQIQARPVCHSDN
jgi:hypothetical protein